MDFQGFRFVLLSFILHPALSYSSSSSKSSCAFLLSQSPSHHYCYCYFYLSQCFCHLSCSPECVCVCSVSAKVQCRNWIDSRLLFSLSLFCYYFKRAKCNDIGVHVHNSIFFVRFCSGRVCVCSVWCVPFIKVFSSLFIWYMWSQVLFLQLAYTTQKLCHCCIH